MKLEFKGVIEESSFILTNFNGASSQTLLQDKRYYKVICAREKSCDIKVDGYTVSLKHH